MNEQQLSELLTDIYPQLQRQARQIVRENPRYDADDVLQQAMINATRAFRVGHYDGMDPNGIHYCVVNEVRRAVIKMSAKQQRAQRDYRRTQHAEAIDLSFLVLDATESRLIAEDTVERIKSRLCLTPHWERNVKVFEALIAGHSMADIKRQGMTNRAVRSAVQEIREIATEFLAL